MYGAGAGDACMQTPPSATAAAPAAAAAPAVGLCATAEGCVLVAHHRVLLACKQLHSWTLLP